MNDQPLVSVIMIFLNAERFIQEAIESIFAQTYENWELLFVDDGSSDDSTSIARMFTEQNPQKILYLEHSGHVNRGTGASRNLGVANARGDYIAFLDADDVWLPDKLDRQVTILESQPEAGMLYGLSQWWYSWTGITEDCQRDFVHELGVPSDTLIQPPELLTPFFLSQRAAIPNPSNILVRSEIFTKVGDFEEYFSGMYEDQSFYTKVCIQIPVFASSECWDRYRQHPNSSSANIQRRGEELAERLNFLNWLAKYLDANGFRDTQIWDLLQKEIWIDRYPILHFLFRDRQSKINRMKNIILGIGRRTIPAPIRSWLWARWSHQDYRPPVGWVRFGNLRRLTPLSRDFGYDRGKPIDRYYIEEFLSDHQEDIGGHVLEINDALYTRQFGGIRVVKTDVLHVEPGNPGATIIADLTSADHIPSGSFDCIILTQTLQFIYDLHSAIQTIHRILKPGGVLLATIPGISPISRYDMEKWGDYWRYTSLSARRLFEEIFPADCVKIRAYGNVLTATAFLYGLATNELKQQELEHSDPDYEIIIAVRATKGENCNN